MFGFLTAILPFVDPIARITDKIVDLRAKRLNAETEQKKIQADEDVAVLQARRDVLISESGSKINALIRIAFAFPCAVYINKLIIWDKVLGWGSTDNLSDNLWWIVMVVIGFYFVERITRIAKR